MSFAERKDDITRRLKKQPLSLPADGAAAVAYGREIVRRILPHRAPMEFIDRITAVDLSGGTIEALSLVPGNAPVFAGHFPGNPIYPGIYQIETMGRRRCAWRTLYAGDARSRRPPPSQSNARSPESATRPSSARSGLERR